MSPHFSTAVIVIAVLTIIPPAVAAFITWTAEQGGYWVGAGALALTLIVAALAVEVIRTLKDKS